jgi:SAM-dependent methyltransferase
MAVQHPRFEDGAAYERMMGTWSRLAGQVFLDWLAPQRGQRWIDIGCGNGAFTDLLVERCTPSEVHGIDPSEGQLAFARSRPCAAQAQFRQGDAMALPFPDNRFDAATMALVIFFVPDPAKGVAEMARVVRFGGLVATYAWDMLGGGFPFEPIHAELREMGVAYPLAPNSDASRMDALLDLWRAAGLKDVRTKRIEVQRTFDSFEDFWTTSLNSSLGSTVRSLSADNAERLKTRVRARLPADASGSVTFESRANAITGRVSK